MNMFHTAIDHSLVQRITSRGVMSIVTMTIIISCGTTKPDTAAAPPKAAPSAPDKVTSGPDITRLGAPIDVGVWSKIVGYNSVWVRQAQPRVLITLKKTAWDEIEGVREGRATLTVLDATGSAEGSQKRNIVMQEGQSRTIYGVTIELKTAFEEYRDGRYEPMVEFRIVQATP